MIVLQIEKNIKELIKSNSKETFIYELLLAYGLPKSSITRLKKGNLNLSKVEGEISWKKKLFFREEYKEDLHLTISKIANELKHNERFIIVTDYKTLLAIDTKTQDKLDCDLIDLPKHYDFFLPWAGMEKAQHANENPADVKAAEKMAKLFDTIKKDNPDDSPEFIHGLNVFLSRLLFCFFAEDTHIFKDNQFTNAIDSHTQTDGSDLNTFLDTIFKVLNTPEKERKNLPEYINAFPYVNGGLFEKEYKTPKFSRSSRSAILNSGDQDWSAINPDIFGSMFQAVIGAEQRGSLGQHYTSVPNIMKVIEPLFLNDLYEEFEKAVQTHGYKSQQKKLNTLLGRIYSIKIFDPACGSGNFLIIAYKELRILEMKIFKAGNMIALSCIQLSQFYGIEIDDFAGEIAKLALWLAEHQMNVEFFKEFGRTNPTLPLKEAGKIVQGNATRLDWEEVCPKTNAKGEPAEVYILGNPPYLGSRNQDASHKADMELVFKGLKDYKKLDYISCWFFLAANYIINSNSKYAFVTTNSVTQGEQVALLWPIIFEKKLEIYFAHQSFMWSNNAKNNAGVAVVIIGIRNYQSSNKYLYINNFKKSVNNISPYLSNSSNIIVLPRTKALSNFSLMITGSAPGDDSNFILGIEEKEELVSENTKIEKFLKKFIGAQELIKKTHRYCIHITEENLQEAIKIPELLERFEKVKIFRLKSKKAATNKKAKTPYFFDEDRYEKQEFILVPKVGSERREYLPVGYFDESYLPSNTAKVIYNVHPWFFGLLSSRMHITWIKAVAGRLKTDMAYSNTLCYNTFPFPPISTQRKNEITQAVFRILEEREKHPEKTLAQLYDPDKMPEGLREAHRQNDIIIEKCYRSTPFKSDEERLEYLFKLYEKMIEEEKNAGTLFEKKKKPRKKRKG